ncbi:hypothetical protein NMY22_g6066 [Coprinellus aureogranulatus]|nr:hypothetical protein NMY22_g6066 [Coprinellus aureogranulatus]
MGLSPQSGLITKTTLTTFSQHITIHNTKSIAIEGLQVIDRIPVSQDSQVKVNLTTPLLNPNSIVPVEVTEGVTAKWYTGEQGDDNLNAAGASGYAGKDGQIAWMCDLASQKRVELSLAWEVSAPSQVPLIGL